MFWRKKKQPKVSYLFLSGSIILNFDGKTFNIHAGDVRFDKVKDAIVNKKLDTIPSIVDVELKLDSNELRVVNDCVYLDGEPLPDVLNMRVLEYMRNDIPFQSLVKFTRKLRKNPSLNSRKMLYAFLEHNGHPITENGNFIAYRGVRDDFKDCHTGKFDNKPGSICEMPRSKVDDNPNNTCSNGLHVACWDYAKGFGSRKIEVEVDPMDVVCVPVDYNGTKMRVCKFEVLAECENMRNETVYGWHHNDNDSDYYGDDEDVFL